MKLFVVAIDKNPNAPGFKYVDITINKSTHDADGIITELKKLGDNFNWLGVLNRSSGPPVITTAIICNYFDLPNLPINSAKTVINKNLLHRFCHSRKIPMPDYKIFSINENVNIQNFKLPLVIKAAFTLIGKSGITIVRKREDCMSAINYASKCTINNRIIVEEYIKGSDHTMIGFVQNKKYYPIIFLDELNKENYDGKISGAGFRVHKPTKDKLLEKNAQDISQELVKHLKIIRSPFISSFRRNEKGDLFLIEVHMDIGGDLVIEEILPRVLPYDFKEFVVKMLMGAIPPVHAFPQKPVAVIYNDGQELIRNKGFKILSEDSHQILSEKIKDAIS